MDDVDAAVDVAVDVVDKSSMTSPLKSQIAEPVREYCCGRRGCCTHSHSVTCYSHDLL